MNKRLARFIRRGTDNSEDNAVVMALTPDGQSCIEQDTIYEIRECLGQLTIVPVGKTHMDRKHWGHEIQIVAAEYEPLLTKDEMDVL